MFQRIDIRTGKTVSSFLNPVPFIYKKSELMLMRRATASV